AAESSVFFTDGYSQDANLGAFVEEIRGEPVFLVDFLLQGSQFIYTPFVDSLFDHALFIGKLKIHGAPPEKRAVIVKKQPPPPWWDVYRSPEKAPHLSEE